MADMYLICIKQVFLRNMIKVKKKAKLRNRYNQVQHQTRDNIWESDKT